MIPKPETAPLTERVKDMFKFLTKKSASTMSNPIPTDSQELTLPVTDPKRNLEEYVCSWYDFVHCYPEIASTQFNVLFAIFMSFYCVIC